MQFLILIALFVWELSQTLIGLLVLVYIKSGKDMLKIERDGYRIFIETHKIGVSLGWFIFWTPAGNRFAHLTNDCRMHEYGHARQSAMLGPLYLIIVGIPSLSRVIYSRYYRRKYGQNWANYFNAFPENWADKLGGVTIQKA
jgi:hypothetical protein